MKRNDELKVFCKNTNEYIDIDGGETLFELYDTIKGRLGLKGEAVCVLVNNKVEDLHYPVFSPKHIEFIDITSNAGYRALTRSLCMVRNHRTTQAAHGRNHRCRYPVCAPRATDD